SAHLDLPSFPTRRSSDLGAHGELGCVQLRHGRFLLERRAVLLEPRRVIHEVLGRLDFGRHVGEREMHTLEAGDGLAELPASRVRSEEHTSELQSLAYLVC